jgi:hypothetical protein
VGSIEEAPDQCGEAEAQEASRILETDCETLRAAAENKGIFGCGFFGFFCDEEPLDCGDFADVREVAVTDPAAILARMEALSNRELQDLFDCDASTVGWTAEPETLLTREYAIDFSRYDTEGVVTVQSEYWDVNWAYDFDERAVVDKITGFVTTLAPILEPLVNDPLVSTTYIKKEFRGLQGDIVVGATSFGYSDECAHWNRTTNHVRQVQLEDDTTVLAMVYLDHPWYLSATHSGFLDYFKFLTPDIVVARGQYAGYEPVDVGSETRWRAPLDALQFWMARTSETEEIDLRHETRYLSVPMLRHLWENAPVLSAEDVAGEWEADLLMNETILRAEARLRVDAIEGGELRTTQAGGVWTDRVDQVWVESGEAHLLMGESPSLVLRAIAGAEDVLVGRRCLEVEDARSVDDLGPWSDFLPHLVREHLGSQFIESDGSGYCLHYLLRRSGPT